VVARANGKVVPLDYQLINGDSVEIVTDPAKHPSITWLSFVKTAKAKDAIKAYVHKMNRDDFVEK
jgi:GTP pyrophosphokinase